MPYYCTVPRCTSMAGKAKNVSFHQFPRDEELAKLWNNILKRGKPYTKYSKVCSLHFRPEDYTITSVGKNKGQWRTLRKDAIPSRNLPSEGPSTPSRRGSGAWLPAGLPPVVDPQVQHQMAQAIYLQTMMAMQASTDNGTLPVPNLDLASVNNQVNANTLFQSEIEKLLLKSNSSIEETGDENTYQNMLSKHSIEDSERSSKSFKCDTCAKCFKDPDVFVLHKRVHKRETQENEIKKEEEENDGVGEDNRQEKENVHTNRYSSEETLRANPILANLLKSGVHNRLPEVNNLFDSNVFNIESQIVAALTANMESYIRNFSTIIPNQVQNEDNDSNSTESNGNDNLNNDDSKFENDNSADRNADNGIHQQLTEDSFDKICDHDQQLSENYFDSTEIKINKHEERSTDFKNMSDYNNVAEENISGTNSVTDFSNGHSSKETFFNDHTKFDKTSKRLLDFETEFGDEIKNGILANVEDNSSINVNHGDLGNNIISDNNLFFKTEIDYIQPSENHLNDDFSRTSNEVT